MISSTIVTACRGPRRWFDLDAVRTDYQGHARTARGVERQANTTKQSPDGNRDTLDTTVDVGAGAPPLDWHHDQPDPGHIRIADNWQPSTSLLDLPLGELARKVVLSMCPWAVCRTCGVARERVTGEPEYVPSVTHRGGLSTADAAMNGGRLQGRRDEASLIRTAPTLGWSDCGHDNYRPGITYDPAAGVLLYRTTEDDMSVRYIVGDTRDVTATIDDASIDLIFTSPPFLALRSYLPAGHDDKHREIGSEANPAAFLDVLLELTAEWGRVLAPHGTLAVELGDTYSGDANISQKVPAGDYQTNGRIREGQSGRQARSRGWPLAKSLALIPQLYAVALAYGINPLTGQPSPAGRWRVRNWIAWHRPNPPVGQLADKWRPASSYITVACRGAKRWFDLDAVRHEHTEDTERFRGTSNQRDDARVDVGLSSGNGFTQANPAGAPPLDWHEDGDLGTGHIILATAPYPGSHYATFPPELPRKIIDCMCPRQVCRVCGVARERVVSVRYVLARDGSPANVGKWGERTKGDLSLHTPATGTDNGKTRVVETVGWSDCGHDNYRPGVVLDPFAGTATSLMAAQDLGRDAIGIDLDERNADLARSRVGMFLEVDHFSSEAVS